MKTTKHHQWEWAIQEGYQVTWEDCPERWIIRRARNYNRWIEDAATLACGITMPGDPAPDAWERLQRAWDLPDEGAPWGGRGNPEGAWAALKDTPVFEEATRLRERRLQVGREERIRAQEDLVFRAAGLNGVHYQPWIVPEAWTGGTT